MTVLVCSPSAWKNRDRFLRWDRGGGWELAGLPLIQWETLSQKIRQRVKRRYQCHPLTSTCMHIHVNTHTKHVHTHWKHTHKWMYFLNTLIPFRWTWNHPLWLSRHSSLPWVHIPDLLILPLRCVPVLSTTASPFFSVLWHHSRSEHFCFTVSAR